MFPSPFGVCVLKCLWDEKPTSEDEQDVSVPFRGLCSEILDAIRIAPCFDVFPSPFGVCVLK